MQALFAAVPALGSLFGGGAAAAGAAAGAGAATAGAVSTLGTLSTLAGVAGTIYTGLYQKAVAENAAKIATENASRQRFAGQVEAQDADIAAAAILDQDFAARAHSGFAADSETFRRQDRRNRIMARRDAERIRQDADLAGSQYDAQAAGYKAEAKNKLMTSIFDVAGAALDFRAGMINDASLVSKRKANQINRIKV